jgi:hypothetical protein
MSWAPAYATPEELAHYMSDASATDTAELTLAVETASRSVDRACNRQFGQVDAPQARYYTARYESRRRQWVIDTDDFATNGSRVRTAPSRRRMQRAHLRRVYRDHGKMALHRGTPFDQTAARKLARTEYRGLTKHHRKQVRSDRKRARKSRR